VDVVAIAIVLVISRENMSTSFLSLQTMHGWNC
jgi:hypothetical protein